jgi:hypothetical protein
VVLTDLFAGGAIYVSGDTSNSGVLDTDETWTYSADYTVTQADLNAGTPLVNVAEVDTDQTAPQSDDETSTVDQNPAIDIEKYVSVNNGQTWVDADSPTGPTLVNTAGIDPWFKLVVTNTGNVTLTDVIVTDTKGTTDMTDDLNINNGLSESITDSELATLDVDETWEYIYALPWKSGQQTNTATADSNQSAPDTDNANYFGIIPGLVTNSSLCTFDTNNILDGKQFNLVFTPNFSLANNNYTLSASNPGQFYYNVFSYGEAGALKSFTFEIPYPFVTQGAVPIHAYSDVHIDQTGGMICLTPGTEIANFKSTDLSQSTGDADKDGNLEYTFSVTVPTSGFVYVNMHLDYGLEKQTGWVKSGTDNAEDNGNVPGSQPTINENTAYTFSSNVTGSTDTVSNDNIFKNIKGVGGKTKLADTDDPLANQSIVLKDTNGKTIGTAKSDNDGWWFTNINAPGKSSTYNVYWDKNNDGTITNDPKQTIAWGGPVKYVNVDFTQAGLHLDSSDAARPAEGVAPTLTQDQLAPVVDAAKAYWAAQGADIQRLQNVDVLIGDLGGTQLGTADNDSLITLDDDAAGHGWSASLGSVTLGEVDLFSAVTHEFGHILGYDHDLMGATLGIGERHLPFEADNTLKDQFPMASPCPSLF